MKTPDSRREEPTDPAIEAAAAHWLVQHDRGLSAAQQDEFLQWLAASPAHVDSFARHRRMWADFNVLAQWRPEHSAEPNPDLLARPKPATPLRWFAPLLAAAAAIAVAVSWAPPGRNDASDAIAFEATSYRQETLSDGTVVDLNRGAHVMLQFTPGERRVVLVQGEAQFAVAHNPARPFVVRAGGVDVRAIGTAFNVKLDGSQLEVLVTEGTVHVAQHPLPTSAPGPAPAATPPVVARVAAGHRTVIPVTPTSTRPEVVPASPREIERLLDWQPRLLDFDSTPLAEVAATFNRRNRLQLVLVDADIGTLPIVASIRSDNVEGFVRLLEATLGLKAERVAPNEIALRRAR
ncbi:MAG: FecR domain-containing protein [Opitutaceae bacterium]|nr:FecR domain-containing protein [Opitutaceae bacterium]